MRVNLWLGILLVAAMVAAGCAGSVTLEPEAGESARVSAVGDDPGVLFDPDDPDLGATISLAERLVAALGSDEAAVDALLLAFDAGYESAQVIAAVEAGSLRADGTIDRVDPLTSPLERLEPVVFRLDRRPNAATLLHRPPADGPSALLIRQPGDQPVFIEHLREEAIARGTRVGFYPLGLEGTMTILTLIDAGLGAEQIIDALLFGEYEFQDADGCFRKRIFPPEPLIEIACPGATSEAPAPPTNAPAEVEQSPRPPGDGQSAVYVGRIPQDVLTNSDSRIELIVSSDGIIGGTLTLREDLACGVVNDCDVSCPTIVEWSADLAPLNFTGDQPFEGTVDGTIRVEVTTIPSGCAEPNTETIELSLAGVVSPDRAEVTEPFAIILERQQPPS